MKLCSKVVLKNAIQRATDGKRTMISHSDNISRPFKGKIFETRSLGALRAPTSSWRSFGPLDFVLCALRTLRPVRRARLKSGTVKIGHFFENKAFFEDILLSFFILLFRIFWTF